METEEETKPKASSSEIGSGTQHESGEKALNDDGGQENGVRVSENGEKKIYVSDDDDKKSKENDSSEDCVLNGVSSLLKLKQDSCDKDKDNNLQVGDFVWGKIKKHPWWPGQIYDPSDASDLALNIKQKGKLLVAYFGDGTFSWCESSQLKPFTESFKECSKISNSRAFLVAVEEAVEEMGRHIESLLISDCADEKHKFANKPEAKNAGIKEGVVRDVRKEMISSLLVKEPGEILKDVKGFAKSVSFSSLLELEVLKRKMSAFYRYKRGYGLIEYHEPESVPGLEDKNNDDEEENIENGVKWWHGNASNKVEEEKEALVDPEESPQRPLEKCSGFPDHRLQNKRKEKSIADILENDSAAKVRFETEPVDELENVITTTSRRRRMSKISTNEDDGPKKVDENGKGKTFSRKRKKMVGEIDKNEVSEDIDSTPLASLLKKVKVDASSSVGNGETSTQTPKRERKKSKYFSPDYLSDFSRKKSKIKSESCKVLIPSQVGEQMADTTDSLMALKDDKPCGVPSDNGLGHQELKKELSNAIDVLRLGGTTKEMRDLIRLSAIGTQYPRESSSRDMLREFMSIYRSFTYRDGANSKFLVSYKLDKEKETPEPETKGKEKKRKAEEIGKENETNPKKGKSKQQEDDEEEEEVEKIQKKKKKKREGKKEFSGAELFVTFGSNSSLPKKEDLIETYEKFGALDEKRTTYMSYNNLSARVAFLNIADGEKAFESSQVKCPFATTSTVKFRLKYPNEAQVAETTMEIEYVKKKLEEMRSLVDESEGGMNEEVKVKLEDKIVNLLEKVRKMRSS